MDSWKNDRIGSAEIGENPTVMIKMNSSSLWLGGSWDKQSD